MRVRGVFIGADADAHIEEIDMKKGPVFDILEGSEYLIIGLPGGSTVQWIKLPDKKKKK